MTELADQDPEAEVAVDLAEQTVTARGFRATFDIGSHVKYRLLHGLDDIEITLRHEEAISAFESRRPGFLPTLD